MPNVYNYNDAFVEILKGVASGTLSNPNNAGKDVAAMSTDIINTARIIATAAESLYDLTVAAPAKGQFSGISANYQVNSPNAPPPSGAPPTVVQAPVPS